MTSSKTPLDATDRRLIDLLRVDPKASNTQLARDLGIAKSTVGSRIDRLTSQNVMRVTACFDIVGLGWNTLSFVVIRVRGRPLSSIVADLVQVKEVIVLDSAMGSWDLIATVVARNHHHLAEIVESSIGRIGGIETLRCDVILRTDFIRHDFGRLTGGPSHAAIFTDFSSEVGDELDDLDIEIVTRLQEDGRTSLAKIARENDVAEGTIRYRVKRLEQERRLEIATFIDVRAVDLDANAMLIVDTDHRDMARTAMTLSNHPKVNIVATTLGLGTLWSGVACETREELSAVVHDELGAIPGVRRITALEVLEMHKHDIRWALYA